MPGGYSPDRFLDRAAPVITAPGAVVAGLHVFTFNQLQPAELVTPGEVSKLVPYLDESVILGGAHFPTVGVVDSLRAGTLMRESAQKAGALTMLPGTEVYGA